MGVEANTGDPSNIAVRDGVVSGCKQHYCEKREWYLGQTTSTAFEEPGTRSLRAGRCVRLVCVVTTYLCILL